jgi:hypothetical protein
MGNQEGPPRPKNKPETALNSLFANCHDGRNRRLAQGLIGNQVYGMAARMIKIGENEVFSDCLLLCLECPLPRFDRSFGHNVAELASDAGVFVTPIIWQKGLPRLSQPPRRFTPHPAQRFFLVPRHYPAPPPTRYNYPFPGGVIPVGQQRWFVRDAEEWNSFADGLKLMACPHCQVVGTLIRHGFLYGFDDSSPKRQTLRARRVFCSNRQARPGCGRTFSVWCANKIRRLSLTTTCLWRFLQHAAAGCIRAFDCYLSDRTWLRIWKRFVLGQSNVRTALSGRCPPPQLTATAPAAHVLAHLEAAFPHADCPIAAFQHALRIFFL